MSDDAVIAELQKRVDALTGALDTLARASKAYLKNAGYFGDEPEDMVETALETYMLDVWHAADDVSNGEED